MCVYEEWLCLALSHFHSGKENGTGMGTAICVPKAWVGSGALFLVDLAPPILISPSSMPVSEPDAPDQRLRVVLRPVQHCGSLAGGNISLPACGGETTRKCVQSPRAAAPGLLWPV